MLNKVSKSSISSWVREARGLALECIALGRNVMTDFVIHAHVVIDGLRSVFTIATGKPSTLVICNMNESRPACFAAIIIT